MLDYDDGLKTNVLSVKIYFKYVYSSVQGIVKIKWIKKIIKV